MIIKYTEEEYKNFEKILKNIEKIVTYFSHQKKALPAGRLSLCHTSISIPDLNSTVKRSSHTVTRSMSRLTRSSE